MKNCFQRSRRRKLLRLGKNDKKEDLHFGGNFRNLRHKIPGLKYTKLVNNGRNVCELIESKETSPLFRTFQSDTTKLKTEMKVYSEKKSLI